MAHHFLPNDQVRLGEGGPIMTVQGYDDHGRVMCAWNTRRDGSKHDAFDEKVLRFFRRIKDLAAAEWAVPA